MIDLNESLRRAALEAIASLDLHNISSFADKNAATMRHLISLGIINDAQIDEALTGAVVNRAKSDYKFLLHLKAREDRVYPISHCIPEYLAFAFARADVFSAEEIGKFSFDDIHAKTADNFKKQYFQPNLLEKLRMNITNPPVRGFNVVNGHFDIRCADGRPCVCC